MDRRQALKLTAATTLSAVLPLSAAEPQLTSQRIEKICNETMPADHKSSREDYNLCLKALEICQIKNESELRAKLKQNLPRVLQYSKKVAKEDWQRQQELTRHVLTHEYSEYSARLEKGIFLDHTGLLIYAIQGLA